MDKIEDKKEIVVETPKIYSELEFATAYEELVEEMGYQIVPNPVFAPTNHGTFEIALEIVVKKLNKKVA